MHMYNTSEACCNINVVRPQMVSVGESKGCTGALITVHCLVFCMDVPCFQYTSLAVVRMEVNHFCFFFMHLVKCMLCYL